MSSFSQKVARPGAIASWDPLPVIGWQLGTALVCQKTFEGIPSPLPGEDEFEDNGKLEFRRERYMENRVQQMWQIEE